MRRLRHWFLALFVLTAWTSVGRSADTEAMVPEEGSIHVLLLRQKSVRDALKLTEEEAKTIHEHNDMQWKKAQEIHKLPRDQRHQKYQELTQANDRFLEQTLTPPQRKRLDEISLQVAGLLLATSPRVSRELNLTEQQKQQLQRHQSEARAELSEALDAKNQANREEKVTELRKTSRKRLMDVLTDEQETRWKELIGAPFEGKIRHDEDEA